MLISPFSSTPEVLVAGTPVGPGAWLGPDGMRLYIPNGWRGESGASDGPDLWLRHDASGAVVALRLDVRADWLPEGCRPSFQDQSRWRILEGLSDLRAVTCPGDEDAALLQAWIGRAPDGSYLAFEAQYPPARLLEGQRAVAVLLEEVDLEGG